MSATCLPTVPSGGKTRLLKFFSWITLNSGGQLCWFEATREKFLVIQGVSFCEEMCMHTKEYILKKTFDDLKDITGFIFLYTKDVILYEN